MRSLHGCFALEGARQDRRPPEELQQRRQPIPAKDGPDLHESLVPLVSYCSARLSAKKEHVILDFRPVLNTVLARQSELISGLLDGCEGERLGKRAPGALVRKARGRPSDR